jgi:magnesium-transporting ATPase (P-type)
MTYTDKRAGIDYNFESLSIENALHENDPQKNPELNYPFWSTDGVQVYTLERQSDLVRECLMLLASAHECVLETDEETGETRYQGPSPDEIALVDAARRMGFV